MKTIPQCASVDMRLVALRKTCVAETGIDEAFIEKVDAEKVLVDDKTLKCYIMCKMKHCGAVIGVDDCQTDWLTEKCFLENGPDVI
ncbi:uncharacterized protein LOC111691491, partial [Anoplophora glabripennis]|uniref:uncharacterized protein LOC111691491 n=1 Tax=Anoplophora glabripennis TaxID=217634 RepID=UPI000C76E7E2